MLVVIGSDVELCNSENMTKISPFTNILFSLAVIILCIISQCSAALSDKQLCYDPNCSAPISYAKTTLSYRANDPELMSFGVNQDVKIFSKSAGKRTDLWGVEINGKRGFAPKAFLREYKILQHKLSYEVPVYKFNDEVDKVDKVEIEKLESSEKVHKAHPPLKNKLSLDKEVLSSESINSDGKSPYEVIDGTTIYFENKPSIQASSVSETAYTTALPTEQASVLESVHDVNSKTVDHDGSSSDKSKLVNNEKLQLKINDASEKLEGIKLSVDTHEETSTEILLDSSEAIINLTSNSLNEDDTSVLNGNIKSEDESYKNLEYKETLVDNSAEENVKDNKKKETTENVETESIFTSLKKTFSILSSSEEIETTESTTTQNSIPTPEATTERNLQLQEQVSENKIEITNAITEKSISFPQTKLDSSEDPNLMSKEKKEIQQEIIQETINNVNISDEEMKVEKEESAILLENTTSPQVKLVSNADPSLITKEKKEVQQKVHENVESMKISDEIEIKKEESTILLEKAISPSDVPSSNNFVHVDADKSAEELPAALSDLAVDSSASAKIDINNHVKNIKMQETSKKDKVTDNIESKVVIVSSEDESTMLSNTQKTAATKSTITQSSDDIVPRFPLESLENAKKDISNKQTVVQTDENAAAAEILESSSSSPVNEIAEDITKELLPESNTAVDNTVITDEVLNNSTPDIQFTDKLIVHSNVNKINDASSDNVPIKSNEFSNSAKPSILELEESVDSSQKSVISEQAMIFSEVPQNLDSLNIENLELKNIENHIIDAVKEEETLTEYDNHISSKDKVLYKDENIKGDNNLEESELKSIPDKMEATSDKVCSLYDECTTEDIATNEFLKEEEPENEEDNFIDVIKLDHNYWKTLMYLCVTAFTTLTFTLGYYYIENIRRDGQLIARINKLEKELLVSTKECEVFKENLNITKEKLRCIEDESFGSNEMVVSLKADLEASQDIKMELEEQVAMLEKDLENATEAGLELERMLREVLSTNNEVNPLAQSVEDLQTRLDAQQAANESITNALNLKAQEIETLSEDLASVNKKCERLQKELSQAQKELAAERNLKNNIEQTLTDKIHSLEEQVNELSTEKSLLYKELRYKEIEGKELEEIINELKSNNLDLEKLYDVSRVKTEAVQLREERDGLKIRLSDVEGAHQLLEEHMKLVKEEIAALSDQCKVAEKEKKDAETRLEVLSNFFKEKEAERQKEEAIWLQKQGEVVSTVERIHTMQNEIQNYKQQIEMLKREIVDQEREYKNQIAALETKAHEQWVAARQNERRLEVSKAEAGQLRNRLTLVEKNLNETETETKLHRLEANGETVTSPPLFLGGDSSSSPVMFSGSSGVPPPPPPSYLHCFAPYLPPLPPASGLPPYDISQRPPPLGGRLSSPPPMPPPLHPPPVSGGRYENASSPPPPMSPPHLLPPFNHHRSPLPPPFGSDHIPPPPLPGSMLPPTHGTTHSWGEESLLPPRNSGFHLHQREQRMRNHKGSLHSSGDSLDKAHHGKV